MNVKLLSFIALPTPLTIAFPLSGISYQLIEKQSFNLPERL
jgi:hypothetical protein